MRSLFVVSMIPMIGFGIMDNFIMIQAGDAIDNTFGATLGIATLTAAAFGQVFSDVAGVLFGGAVDRGVARAGIRPPDITSAQRALAVSKNVIMAGSVVGVTIGCLLGASCLLFMDLSAADRKKQAQQLNTILETVMDHGDELIEAERSSVFVGDRERNEMWSKYASGMADGGKDAKEEPSEPRLFAVPMNKSIVGECFLSGKILNIPDVSKHENYAGKAAKNTGFRCQSILCAPVIDRKTGEVLAVVEFLNKKSGKGEAERAFDGNDEKLARMLAHHIGVFMEKIGEDDD
ncbi:hypothetical protein TeGR_g8024 [Tetraparma gracilis]|uniref:GAF domain-containing protein n=1 Tax=Tetraparma gracilis TaxID=2962635 RepID=A0ABQ6MWB1_9STRA|nr:hypothetical protein TeGR_g8024 [Tetraparma gracilis]